MKEKNRGYFLVCIAMLFMVFAPQNISASDNSTAPRIGSIGSSLDPSQMTWFLDEGTFLLESNTFAPLDVAVHRGVAICGRASDAASRAGIELTGTSDPSNPFKRLVVTFFFDASTANQPWTFRFGFDSQAEEAEVWILTGLRSQATGEILFPSPAIHSFESSAFYEVSGLNVSDPDYHVQPNGTVELVLMIEWRNSDPFAQGRDAVYVTQTTLGPPND